MSFSLNPQVLLKIHISSSAFDLVKYSYPPKPLPTDQSTLLSSIPITKGEQIVVTELTKSLSSSSTTASHSTTHSTNHHSTSAPSAHSRHPGPPMIKQSAPVSSAASNAAKAIQEPVGKTAAGVDKSPVVVELPDDNGFMNHGENPTHTILVVVLVMTEAGI
jgi:hypothetical protein